MTVISRVEGILLMMFFTAGLSGCSTLGYLSQAGWGQLELLNKKRPIADVIRDPRTPPRVRELLAEVAPIKQFGERHGLKATGNYSDYVALDRSAVTWVVSASERLRFVPKTWSFPIAGSFTYLGWFNEERARAYAAQVERDEDLDVDVRGASAYSTLGWFRDPLLSTMLSRDESALGDLVNVILHESVHATVYVSGQSYFNESLAEFAAERMTSEYFSERFGVASAQEKAYQQALVARARRTLRFQQAYQELSSVYASAEPEARKLDRKRDIFARLREELQIKREINNATMIQFKTYGVGQGDFAAAFEKAGKNWDIFFARLGRLRTSDFGASQREDFSDVIKKAFD